MEDITIFNQEALTHAQGENRKKVLRLRQSDKIFDKECMASSEVHGGACKGCHEVGSTANVIKASMTSEKRS